MSTPVMIGIYQPGNTILHRLPVGVKMSGLGLLSIAIVVIRDARAAVAFLAFTLLLAAIGRVHVAALVKASRAVLLIAVIAALLQWWLKGPERAIETLVDLVALALGAVVLTSTTAINTMLDAIIRWIGPLQRVGVNPDRVALTFALAMRAIPGTIEIAQETRDAARARGLGNHPRAFLSPFVIRVVARAYETGDALAARGIGDD
jgi:biotin transport system permease protein